MNFKKNSMAQSVTNGRTSSHKGYNVKSKGDDQLLREFETILDLHQIEYSHLSSDQKGIFVPVHQPQYQLIEGIFEERTTFQDSLFYDVSAWTLPHAMNLDFKKSNTRPSASSGKNQEDTYDLEEAKYAYSFSLQSSNAYPMHWI